MQLSIWPRPSHDWEAVHRIAAHAEQRGWHGVWFPDHFMPASGDLSRPVLECWSTLAGLAASVPRVRLGALVSGNTYRHPAVLANVAATTDRISGGRVVLGIGAGWQENEHAAYGLDFGSTGTRMDRLEEACRVIRSLRDLPRTSFAGRHYHLQDAPMEPKPSGPLPLLVGGGGERRTLPIAARHADEWNVWGTVATFAHKAGVLDRACADVGRDPASVRRSTQVLLAVRHPDLPHRGSSGRMPVVDVDAAELGELLAGYTQAGVDELIVPDFNYHAPEETLALIDLLTDEITAS